VRALQSDKNQVFGAGVLIIGLLCFFLADPFVKDETLKIIAGVMGFVLALMGAGIFFGLAPKSLNFGVGQAKVQLEYFQVRSVHESVAVRKLPDDEIAEKESHAKAVQREHPLPGHDAPRYTALSSTLGEDLLVRPSAYPTTPMYLLDNAFRIIDWNEAFTVAFDRTMEGRKGRGVLEWTYFLDNYEEVLDHGIKKFGDANASPTIDVEPIAYTSRRYGKLTAIKRAYQIPDDTGACLAWLVTLDLKFAEQSKQVAFNQDLIRLLGLDLMWSEYALSYDRVLNATKVYPELLSKFMGGYDDVPAIPEDARILDLGAGTGNMALQIITSGRDRVIFAVENNRVMLQLLGTKCKKFLRTDVEGGGIIALKQDATSLFGLDDNYFDYVIANNVLYSIEDVEACLSEVCRVLKPGGEFRLSGPRKDTKLPILFERIRKDLKDANKFEELEPDFRRILEINELRLRPMLHRWSTDDVKQMLLNAGFSKILHASEDIYAGQSMFIAAVK
jgi:ubiquinone/menaquinone biosynthesis C-methylase UbiE